jgi:DNA-binding IscR family transcriptional regulator
MKLTVRGEYALRALTHLGLRHSAKVIQISAISAAENIPKRFLEQILNDRGMRKHKRSEPGHYVVERYW